MRAQRILTRAGVQSTGHKCYMIGVPWQIAEALPANTVFKPELTEDGLLFRPVLETVVTNLPTWAKEKTA